MIYNYQNTLNISYPDVVWKLIDPDAEVQSDVFVLPGPPVYPDCFEATTGTLPSKSDIDAEIVRLQGIYDNKEYQRTRAEAYPELKEQLDLLYHDMAANKGDKTGEWFKAVKAVKDATAKPS